MPILSRITGPSVLQVGSVAVLYNDVPGGEWSSLDESVLVVDTYSGEVKAVGSGTAVVMYAIGRQSVTTVISVFAYTMTNGLDLTRLLPAMQGRLGWHAGDRSVPELWGENSSAASGRYYDRGFHKAVTLKNVYDTAEVPNMDGEAFNKWLIEEDQAVTLRCINAIFNRPQLIEHKLNYTRTANTNNVLIPNNGRICGYRINIAPGNYAVVINNVSLLFTEDVKFTLYLFNDLLSEPVYAKDVKATAHTQTVVNLEWRMNYLDTGTNNNMGGVWYLAYYQDDLKEAQAIDEELNLWCDSKVFGAYPFETGMGDKLPDWSNPSVNYRSYGLNMEVSSYRDYTQKLVENAHLLDEARGLCMALNMLEQIRFTNRSDSAQRNMQALTEALALDMDRGATDKTSYVGGLRLQLERELKRLHDNFWPEAQAMSVPVNSADWTNEPYYEGMDVRALPPRGL